MYGVKAAFDTELLDDLQVFARDFPELVDQGVRRDIRPFVSQQVDKQLRREPGKPKYPIRWQSEKQRRAYFATNGFGKGIPYERSHKSVQSWTVSADYKNRIGEITVTNTQPHAVYLFGPRQQLFHHDTGWPFAPNVLQVISLEANERLRDLWAMLVFKTLRSAGK